MTSQFAEVLYERQPEEFQGYSIRLDAIRRMLPAFSTFPWEITNPQGVVVCFANSRPDASLWIARNGVKDAPEEI